MNGITTLQLNNIHEPIKLYALFTLQDSASCETDSRRGLVRLCGGGWGRHLVTARKLKLMAMRFNFSKLVKFIYLL